MSIWDDPAFETPQEKAPAQPRGIKERFTDSYLESALHSPMGGEGVVRLYLKSKGYSADQINTVEKHMSDHFARRRAADPARQGDFKHQGAANIGRLGVDLAGNLLGGVDPTYAVNFGKTAVARILSQMGVNGLDDLLGQGLEVHRGVRDKIDKGEVLLNTAAGALFQGAGELAKGVSLGRAIRQGMKHPDFESLADHIIPDLEGGGSLARPKTSPKGAMGVMQVMPDTARDPGFGIRPWNGKTQADLARVGKQYTAAMLHKYDGDTTKVLAAYNAGPGAVDNAIARHGDDWAAHLPSETQKYVSDGMKKLGKTQGPEDLGPVELTQNEQPSLQAQEGINDLLAPPAEDKPPVDINADNNVVNLDNERAIRDDKMFAPTAEDFHSNGGFDPNDDFADVLTPAERQDMDASVDKPVVDNTGYEKHTPYLDEVPAPVNDNNVGKRGVIQTFMDMLNDESGSINGDETPKGPDGEDPNAPTARERLVEAIRQASPLRAEQDRAYSRERAKRFSEVAKVQQYADGREGLYAQLAKMKGELPKMEFASILNHLSHDDIRSLFNEVWMHPRLTTSEKLHAGTGLEKLFGEHGGAIPTEGELEHLKTVFGDDLVNALERKRSIKLGDVLNNILNIPRALKSTLDFSAPLRQGAPLMHKKEFYTAFASMYGQAFSEKKFQAIQNEIYTRPSYRLMKEGGLALTKAGKNLSEREEAFMSNWAEKIPVLGKLVRGSDRAYIGFLNKLRADVFDSLVRDGEMAGIDFKENPKALKDIAKFINTSTGRGSLEGLVPGGNSAAPFLAGAFFSPRLMASRANMLNPVYYMRLSPFARKEAIKSMVAYGGAIVTVLTLLKLSGVDVETDPTSTDFAKIKISDKSRLDITGGFSTYLRLAAQLATGKTTNADGKVTDLTADGFHAKTRVDAVQDFFASKENPVLSFSLNAMRGGRDSYGHHLSKTQMGVDLLAPMIASDTYDVYKDLGPKGLMTVPLNLHGIGVQTYTDNKTEKKPKDDFEKEFKDFDFDKDFNF
jgi:hypothetical protein